MLQICSVLAGVDRFFQEGFAENPSKLPSNYCMLGCAIGHLEAVRGGLDRGLIGYML